MSFNCKAQELAYVIRPQGAKGIPVGHVVRCLQLYPLGCINDANGKLVKNIWHVEYRGQDHGSIGMFGVCDADLFPIRNPGDDEVDARDVLIGQGATA